MLEVSPGERLRTLRELLGLTQTQLAHVTSLRQSWISDVENSRREPTGHELETVAAATGTPVRFFFVGPSSVPRDSLQFRKSASASKIATSSVTMHLRPQHRCEPLSLAVSFASVVPWRGPRAQGGGPMLRDVALPIDSAPLNTPGYGTSVEMTEGSATSETRMRPCVCC
jgi:transcriptional regulator with XRE-family HTH domain